jgi:hypothetical protein
MGGMMACTAFMAPMLEDAIAVDKTKGNRKPLFSLGVEHDSEGRVHLC